MISASEALQRLRAGNERFASGNIDATTLDIDNLRKQLEEGQEPFAVVLGCSDSRVPVELVFDQGVGDLFVIRVAGNIVAPAATASIEYAVQTFGTRLVVVLGHSRCGAIQAAVDELRDPGEQLSKNLRFILRLVQPAVDSVVAAGYDPGHDELVGAVVRENIRRSVEVLRKESDIIDRLVSEEGLTIVGAEYSLHTGEVEFF